MSTSIRDVTIVGGGLAGLSLALQLRSAYPDLDVLVLEREQHPVPIGTWKVGESTVEIGAHYLSRVIGLEKHLHEAHLRKNGLRLFFQGDAQRRSGDLASADEIGVSRLFHIPSFQVDRGVLENELGRRAVAAGIEFRTGCRVTSTTLNKPSHELRFENGSGTGTVRTRWLVDAASRHSPLKRSLDIARPSAHRINSAWFRVEGRVRVDDWSDDADWQRRCTQLPRWHSTNHLMGPGYWVWLIPLASNMTSVGIVADPDLHPLEEINSHDKAMAWLAQHQPRCAEALVGLPLLDFRFLRDLSHDCRQVFSDEHWALTGESGRFIDPFYSPGTDFIAISNSYISKLVGLWRSGARLRRPSLTCEQLYLSFYQSTLSLYQGLYPGFGDRHLMALKTTWDYAYYWGVLALLFFSGGLLGEAATFAASPFLQRAQRDNLEIQERFRQRARHRICEPGRGAFIDQRAIPCLAEVNLGLTTPPGGEALTRCIASNVDMLSDLAQRLIARMDNPELLADGRERELLGDLRERLL